MSSETLRQRSHPAGDSKRDVSKTSDKPTKSKEKGSAPGSGLGCGTLLKISLGLFVVLPVSMFMIYIYTVPEDSYPVPFVLPDPPSLKVNNHLASAERLFEGKIYPPEAIVHHNGDLYTGLLDGSVIRISNGEIKTIAKFGRPPCGGFENEAHCGTPLGLKFDNDGFLIVCDAYLGLYKVNVATGDFQQLLPASVNINGRHLAFLNNLDITKDGVMYLSDSSVYNRRNFPLDLLDGRPTGRLMRYDPVRNTTEVLLEGLGFANGVQLSKHEDYVLVAETFRARILKYHIHGIKAGTAEVFADNLPCVPDNIRPSSSGGYWVASGISRYREKNFNAIDFMGPRPWIRKILSWIPPSLWLGFDPNGSILLELNEKGEIVRTLMDLEGKTVLHSSGVEDVNGVLYIGSYKEHYIAKINSRKF